MRKRYTKIDKVRASRDGHEFHEAWAARMALRLVATTDGLVGIAVEGLSPRDQSQATAGTVEIADLVLYYGNQPNFRKANSVVIIQLKYSISSNSVPFRASDAKKTIRKFAEAFKNHKKIYGAKAVNKLSFELVTNRPIYDYLTKAISELASGTVLKGETKKQAAQFTSASGLKARELVQFAKKVRIIGLAGNLIQNKQYLSRILSDWSAAPDAIARARLGNIRQMLRDKAGYASEGRNVITRTDVLDALELQGPEDLLPCPASFPDIGKVVTNRQLPDLLDKILHLTKPLMIHAEGGAGKTVLLQSLAGTLGKIHETVLFDCFGGGTYRAPEDARHLPKRGLIHIINKLALRGLCDPLLPNNDNLEELICAFRRRLSQAVAALRTASPDKQLIIFIDAIDNAAEHAKDKGESAFPSRLIESFHYKGPVDGVKIVCTCRSYRRDISRGSAPPEACDEFELQLFSLVETGKYLSSRIRKITETEIKVAHSRSQGNPRILEHLALSDRGLLDSSEINNPIELNDLLRERIRKALADARTRGYKESEIKAFLAGLSVLPPPVPIDQYADAHGMELSTVKSFASDLAPLLDQTKHGLVFRDEPTETFVREVYAANEDTLRILAENLLKKQGESVYAASALPGLLQQLGDGKLLFELAFDKTFPSVINSTVGKQNIRYKRLKAAVRHTVLNEDFDHLVHLLVELSTLAAVNHRGAEYLLNNPDLIIASHDVDATRRLFETRTIWPGTRYARITIARALIGDLDDAYRYTVRANEWIDHFIQQNEDYRQNNSGPDKIDIASIPLCLVAQDRGIDAARYMGRWKDWYAFEVSEHVFKMLNQAVKLGTTPATNVKHFLDALDLQPGVIASALSFLELNKSASRKLVQRLAQACSRKKTLEISGDRHSKALYRMQDGLLKAAGVALAMRMLPEAVAIADATPQAPPGLWSFNDRWSNNDVFYFIVYTAVRAASEEQAVTERMLLPSELVNVAKRVPDEIHGIEFKKTLITELEESPRSSKSTAKQRGSLSYETKRDAKQFVDEKLLQLLLITQALTAFLSSSSRKADKRFQELLDLWSRLRMKSERYSEAHEISWFFDSLGRQLLSFALWTRSDIKASSAEVFISKLGEFDTAPVSALTQLVSILTKKSELHELAGDLASKAKTAIEREDEVSSRASAFGELSRAILPASPEEARSYFRLGLEQMDVIGSGDYQFTNELLSFAGSLTGKELEDADFHTLSNICELNIYDQDKFPWLDFGRAFANVSGLKALAKLARWDDRDKCNLNYTLLPYITALIEQDKIDPAIALGLLRISAPAEFYVCGTEQLAELIVKKQFTKSEELLKELILQFEQTHPGVFMPNTLATLHKIAKRELPKDSEITTYLSTAAPKFQKLRDEQNASENYRASGHPLFGKPTPDQSEKDQLALVKILEDANPADEMSMAQAVDSLYRLGPLYKLREEFLNALRKKVKYSQRPKYIRIISRHESLGLFTKIDELKRCKDQWTSTSIAIEEVFREMGMHLIEIHANDLILDDFFADSSLKDISLLSNISPAELALVLIRNFAKENFDLPASIWMNLAAIVCQKTTKGEGQIALKRLLNSNAAKLASTVVDGVWKDGLYPEPNETDIAAGLIWRCLGGGLR